MALGYRADSDAVVDLARGESPPEFRERAESRG